MGAAICPSRGLVLVLVARYEVLPAARSCCTATDRLVSLPGVHVTDVDHGGGGLLVAVETPQRVAACHRCGTVAASHGRRTRWLHDIPCAGVPVRVAGLLHG